MKFSVYLIALHLLFLSTISCQNMNREKLIEKSSLNGNDYRLFQNTPAWNLAKAVWDQDISKIENEVSKNPKIINYQEDIYKSTLLDLSAYNGQNKSFSKLLELGANPNLANNFHCTTPLVMVSDQFDDKYSYAEKLIEYGADTNYQECLTGKDKQITNRTALICASLRGHLDIVKLLLKNGADINFTNVNGENALSNAIIGENYDIALYLLQNGAKCKLEYKELQTDGSFIKKEFSLVEDIKIYANEDNFKNSKEYDEIVNYCN